MTQQERLATWNTAVDKVIKRAGEEVFTTKEIQKLVGELCELDSSPIQGIRATIKQKEVIYEMPETGICDGSTPSVQQDPLLAEEAITAHVSIHAWPQEGHRLATEQWYNKVLDFFRATWLPEVRERQVGLLDLKLPLVRSRLTRSINRLVKEHPALPVYAVYFDLDKFKQMNSELHHGGADLVLAHVGACVQRICNEATILGFRNGGDEFSLLAAGTSLAKLLGLLYGLSTSISSKTFGGAKELTVGMTAGIATVSEPYTLDEIDEAINQAEIVTKNAAGDKRQRGTVSIASTDPGNSVELHSVLYAKLGAVFSRTCQQNPAPFANAILNIISDKAAACVSNGIVNDNAGEHIDRLIAWLGIDGNRPSHEENLYGQECLTSDLSNLEIAIALHHGLARSLASSINKNQAISLPRLTLKHGAEDSSAAIFVDDKLIWGKCSDVPVVLDLGMPIAIKGVSSKNISGVVAFQIGFQDRIKSPSGRLLPDCLFSEIVVVDDRPKIGGGLPDFWQAAVANIISAVGANRSFNSLLVVGNPTDAPETTSRIRGEVDLNVDELVAITALKRAVVESSISRLRESGTVKYENDAEDILQQLYASSLELSVWEVEEKSAKHERAPKLKRNLDVGSLGLGALDGLKSDTASQAYPAIIEIMRTSEAANETYDDASQPLREIVGFKLVLDTPTNYPVPDYWSEQEAAFAEYAERVLLSKTGVISTYFHGDGQYDAFIRQLAEYCRPECNNKSTRRAILVVRNMVKDAELRPLGLVSVWAAPRHHTNICSIEFSFVWRTVEALVGLPYSLYGSIKLVDQIVDSVKDELQTRFGISSRINAGRLTYLALSLHMRIDEFHKRIAKRIADAASV